VATCGVHFFLIVMNWQLVRTTKMKKLEQNEQGSRSIQAGTRQDITATAGEILSDGTVLELVWSDLLHTNLNLLVYKSGNPIITPFFEHSGKIYAPPIVDQTILRAIQFPSGVKSFGSVRELFDDAAHSLARKHDLPEEFIRLTTYFNFATWVPERLPSAPLLSIVAPAPAPSELLMQDLANFCRRPLLLSDPSAADLLALPFDLRPTLLLHVSHARPDLQTQLCASLRRRFFFAKRSRAVDLFGPKVVCSRLPLKEVSRNGAAIEIALNPTRRQTPFVDPDSSDKLAADFQSRFLSYRLQALRLAHAPQIDCEDLSNPMATLAQALANGIVGDKDLQRQIVPLLRRQDREFQVDVAASMKCIVVEALLTLCHDGYRQTFVCLELAQVVNTILKGRGENLQVSPEDIGWDLKSLGFHTEPIGRRGKGLKLTDSIRKIIHELAVTCGVRSLQGGAVAKCRHCSEPHAQQAEERET